MWEKGQKVLCVDDRFHNAVWDWGDQLPRRGRVYTIQAVRWAKDGVTGIFGYGCLLEELKNPGDRLSFATWHFQPLITQQAKRQNKMANAQSETVQRPKQLELQMTT